MRVAVASSVTLHIAVITVTAIALPRSAYKPVELPPVLPVEFLRIAEETDIAPAIVEEAEAPEPEIAPEPEMVAEAPKPPPPKPQPEPELTPEPEPVAPEPEPVPPPLEEIAELKPVEPEPEPEPEAPSAEEIAEIKPAAKPENDPAPDSEAEPEDDFFTQTAALIDKAPRKEKARKFHQRNEQPAETMPDRAPNEAAGLQTGLTVSEIDAIRAQMKPCWRPPTGAPNAGELVVVLRVRFQPDGYVMGKPDVLDPARGSDDSYLRAAADRAVAAVLQCQPFNLPVERYRSWATSEISFDPRFLLGR